MSPVAAVQFTIEALVLGQPGLSVGADRGADVSQHRRHGAARGSRTCVDPSGRELGRGGGWPVDKDTVVAGTRELTHPRSERGENQPHTGQGGA